MAIYAGCLKKEDMTSLEQLSELAKKNIRTRCSDITLRQNTSKNRGYQKSHQGV